MIPSDHFVKFYNEVFKYLDRRGNGELEKYYALVSKNQEFHCLECKCRHCSCLLVHHHPGNNRTFLIVSKRLQINNLPD